MHNGDTLDVLNIIERLEGGGVPHEQAKVQAAVLVDVVTGECKCMKARYVTRGDLSAALVPLESGIQVVDAKVDRLTVETKATAERLAFEAKATAELLGMRIDKTASDLKSEMMKWTISVWFLQLGLFAALLFQLPR